MCESVPRTTPRCGLAPPAFLAFFFSSRRRHTRSLRDWSSDVCSSDLPHAVCCCCTRPAGTQRSGTAADTVAQIGRAACRERGEVPVVGEVVREEDVREV